MLRYMQESGRTAAAAQLPKGLPVLLLHELADSCQVGDRVEVTGILLLQMQGAVSSGVQTLELPLLHTRPSSKSRTYRAWLKPCLF